ncbi:spore germination protein [Cohnella pontilimi]|uniref:Spore germination protein n=1 Tax=Cohnella pontilimi TaxID=2564100 RepID=A0A4U0FAB8_9BACL|nr:spore germination protein [Cohnella pontilimi]
MLDDNTSQLKESLGCSPDLVMKEVRLHYYPKAKLKLVYIAGMADVEPLLDSFLLEASTEQLPKNLADQQLPEYLKTTVFAAGDIQEIRDYETLFAVLFAGSAVILLDGYDVAIAVGTKGGEKRGVEEPNTQVVIRGPREGFTETLNVNTALVRRIIRDNRLWLESRKIGTRTQTDVAIMYIKGLADEKVLQELRCRLDKIDIDGILESGYIEEFIQEKTLTPFPTVFNTERPDTVAGSILEGRVAIFVQGTPFVLIIPALFVQFLQSSEDYYERADFATLIRLLRYISFGIALLAPSVYIAVTTYHQELLPTSLLISLAGQREGVPFPAVIEALMMEITFEILREGGLRMPKPIGQSVSIVGTLVIGQSAVQAGLVSAAMVIVVSLTAIANFVIPAFNMAISVRMLRFFLMMVAATAGLYGLFTGMIAVVLHLCSLKSFGVPYMSPIAPIDPDNTKDSLIRAPWRSLFARPRSITPQNVIRKRKASGSEAAGGKKQP